MVITRRVSTKASLGTFLGGKGLDRAMWLAQHFQQLQEMKLEPIMS